MSEDPKAGDAGAIWRNQPAERLPVELEAFLKRRTRELHSSTRAEILVSIGAALLFVAVINWRLGLIRERVPPMELIAAAAWVAISVYWFRDWIWRAKPKDALAATGLAHYRKELERRRDHMRNAWIWHGPLFLACLTLAAVWTRGSFPGLERAGSVAVPILLLAVWTAFGLWRRRLRARELQREIDELGPSGSGGGA